MLKIPRRNPLTATVGMFSVGLDTYWGQFPGLRDEMQRKSAVFRAKLELHSVTVTDFGMVDNAIAARAALAKIRAADLDVLFVDMTTYAASSTFGLIVRALDIPVVLVALQEMPALDYAHGTTFMQLANDDLCAVPEFTGVAVRMGKPVADVIVGMRENDAAADAKIADWCRIAHVRHDLRRARIGHLGHVLEAMLDMHTDPTAVTAAFGCHVVQCEAGEVLRELQKVTAAEVTEMTTRIREFFATPAPGADPITAQLTAEDLDTAARSAVALERFIAAKNLDGLAYYYEAEPGSELRRLVTNFIVGNSLLTAAGFPMCGEYDIKNCLAMLIMDRLEIGGSFAEFHPIDFSRNTVLVGHDGPHHLNIADRKPVLRSLSKYHGKPGAGAGVEFNIQTGPITILSIGVKADGKFKFVIAEGESLAGAIPPTGNTNTHGLFPPDVRTFLARWCLAGPTHHFALGVGHAGNLLKKVAAGYGIEAVMVTE